MLIKWLSFVVLLSTLFIATAHAATHNAATCNTSDVQAAINSAADGDTVIIPNGSCTWATGLTTNKGIKILGQTKGSVILTMGGNFTMLAITTNASNSVEIGNLNFMPPASPNDTGMYISIGGNDTDKPPLIHDNYFNVPDFALLHTIAYARNGGVIWNNTMESLTTNGSIGSGSGSGGLQLQHGSTNSWITASTMGTADTNGLVNTYIEDNTFNNIYLQVIDCSDGSRAVIRHNTFNDSAITCHGGDTGTPAIAGNRHTEVYNNTFNFHASGTGFGGLINYPIALSNGWWYMRGGTGIFANNAVDQINSSMWGKHQPIGFIVQQLHRNATDGCCPEGYACLHQPGQGSNSSGTQVLEPFYIWGNTGTGESESPAFADYTPDACGHDYITYTTANYVRLNRDFYAGTAKPGWTPYTYPHPLRAGSGGGGGGTGPNPPTGLSAVIQ